MHNKDNFIPVVIATVVLLWEVYSVLYSVYSVYSVYRPVTTLVVSVWLSGLRQLSASSRGRRPLQDSVPPCTI